MTVHTCMHVSTNGNTLMMHAGGSPTAAPTNFTLGSDGELHCGKWTNLKMVGLFNANASTYLETVPESGPDACQQLCWATANCTAFTWYERSTSNCIWTDTPTHMLYPCVAQPWEGENDDEYSISMVTCEEPPPGGYPKIFGAV